MSLAIWKVIFLNKSQPFFEISILFSLLVGFLLYHFSVAKTRCRKVYCMRNTLSNISQKKYKKKRIYHNCAKLVR